jgi:hypothetical protein
MSRRALLFSALAFFLAIPRVVRADAFDYYTNQVLEKVPSAEGAQVIKQLTPNQMVEHSRVLSGITATFLAVKTNEGRWAKLLVQPARQKVNKEQSVPILLIERFVTYREGEERAIVAEGKNVRLFHDFRFNLDLGQVVPAALGGDLRFVADNDNVHVEPVGKAEVYLLTKPLPEATPKKGRKLVVGATFEPRYFNGAYKLYDDGRRSGTLHLKVADDGEVSGHYYSDKDGQKYEVEGKVGNPKHAIFFKITFPKTLQTFQGLMFTGDGKAITGFSRLQERETGFYAVRLEKE